MQHIWVIVNLAVLRFVEVDVIAKLEYSWSTLGRSSEYLFNLPNRHPSLKVNLISFHCKPLSVLFWRGARELPWLGNETAPVQRLICEWQSLAKRSNQRRCSARISVRALPSTGIDGSELGLSQLIGACSTDFPLVPYRSCSCRRFQSHAPTPYTFCTVCNHCTGCRTPCLASVSRSASSHVPDRSDNREPERRTSQDASSSDRISQRNWQPVTTR